MIALIIIIIILFLAVLFLTAPQKASKEQKEKFIGRYYAHRGLHKTDGSAPENSLPAFKLAAEKGYGIELDVHITTDDQIVVFHDDDLKRMCGVDKATEDNSYEELKALRLLGTEHTIPLFTEVLSVYNAAGPIVLEFKTGKRKYELCQKTYEILKTYKGDVCIESFDPRIVAWWKKNAPEYVRGQLAQPTKFYKDQSVFLSFALANSLLNFLGRPHFVAYKLAKKPLGTLLCEMMGAMRFSWTSKDISDKTNQDGIIFEGYEPPAYL